MSASLRACCAPVQRHPCLAAAAILVLAVVAIAQARAAWRRREKFSTPCGKPWDPAASAELIGLAGGANVYMNTGPGEATLQATIDAARDGTMRREEEFAAILHGNAP